MSHLREKIDTMLVEKLFQFELPAAQSVLIPAGKS
jgi:hypothetical protein